MKFTTTENRKYSANVGYTPKSWLETEETDHRKAVTKYFYDNIKLHDWDFCGDETHDFLFEDGKALRLYYSWWSEWYHEDEEENGLKDEYYFEDITAEEANVPDKKMRDWL